MITTYKLVHAATSFNVECYINGRLEMTFHHYTLQEATDRYERAEIILLLLNLPSTPTHADGVSLGQLIRARYANQFDWALETIKTIRPNLYK